MRGIAIHLERKALVLFSLSTTLYQVYDVCLYATCYMPVSVSVAVLDTAI
ncbi:unnamed protein product [Photorhabdus laumondii subsp. laumondii TTO1]|uniref:Photorhabdus luminescens subsp. laumondii TTO1 complete genome segment 7/17 n=1 Tax=Photorhabdus laumondii subsp. laumondii (strain DSM 15139 / CIP 105565 / TT01) TaxID=243265 RepID=Q7N5U7_PHOLL|nr:unnamed protein product [Photorhabdus laumondii subsp. laumondii TTO1]